MPPDGGSCLLSWWGRIVQFRGWWPARRGVAPLRSLRTSAFQDFKHIHGCRFSACLTGVRARAHTHMHTHGRHFLSGHFLMQGPVSRPRPPLPLLTHRPQGLPTCRPAGSLAPRESRAFCEVSPWSQWSEPPSQLTNVSYSLFCQILWSTKYFEFYVNIMLPFISWIVTGPDIF